MADTITFTIPGKPVAKGRARAFVRNGRVAHYTPKETADYERLVRETAQEAMIGQAPLDGPVALVVIALVPIPASWSRRRQQAAGAGATVPTSRPDLDNIVKAIKDGLNGVAWRDDSQVVELRARKSYGHTPCVQVRVRAMQVAEVN